MIRRFAMAALVVFSGGVLAQTPARSTFDVATIKPVESTAKSPRYITMQGQNRFVEKDYTLKLLIAAAYNLNPRTISGGPGWMESDHYDITAVTPGEALPTRDEQMAMLQSLLADRFKLTFHREQKEFSIFALQVAKGGSKLKESTAAAGDPSKLLSIVYPQKMVMPARNATLAEFCSTLQRAILDRPVVNKTGLAGRYDFDLEWAPDETQFRGEVGAAPEDAPSPHLFAAVQEQLGLRLVATKGPVEALVVDKVERPSAN
jgi:uncharacterized protein (TIGR03435 family)